MLVKSKAILLENVLGIAVVMDEVLDELKKALPDYEVCVRILDPFLASNFTWALFDLLCSSFIEQCHHHDSL